jgi:hypothetical protein
MADEHDLSAVAKQRPAGYRRMRRRQYEESKEGRGQSEHEESFPDTVIEKGKRNERQAVRSSQSLRLIIGCCVG